MDNTVLSPKNSLIQDNEGALEKSQAVVVSLISVDDENMDEEDEQENRKIERATSSIERGNMRIGSKV